MISRKEWAAKFCKQIGAPVTTRNLWALVAWESAEGTKARFNPLATTKRMPGSWDFNSVPVQNYPDLATGLKATKQTLQESGHRYEPILFCLKQNTYAIDTLRAVAASAWGTGDLAIELLDDVKKWWSEYADLPIGQ
jgi:hypothetical protein